MLCIVVIDILRIGFSSDAPWSDCPLNLAAKLPGKSANCFLRSENHEFLFVCFSSSFRLELESLLSIICLNYQNPSSHVFTVPHVQI